MKLKVKKSTIPSGSLTENYLPADYSDVYACVTDNSISTMAFRKKYRVIYLGLFFCIPFMFSSCLNYNPCRGQDYLIDNITHKGLINKFHELREKYPEIVSARDDYINEHLPHYYIELYWNDLDVCISLDIHTGDQIPNPPTRLKFTLVNDRDATWHKDINSKELDKKLNEQYKEKFEKEILGKLGVKWQRKSCW